MRLLRERTANMRKTHRDQRGVYRYYYTDGLGDQKIILQPGTDGVTAADIKQLHALDDSEVYYCNKSMPKRTLEESAQWEEYERLHFDNAGSRGNYSLDQHFPNQENPLAAAPDQPVKSELEYQVEELLNQMPEMQSRVFRLVVLEEYRQAEVCGMLGLSKATVSEHLSKAKTFLRKNIIR